MVVRQRPIKCLNDEWVNFFNSISELSDTVSHSNSMAGIDKRRLGRREEGIKRTFLTSKYNSNEFDTVTEKRLIL